MSWNNIHKWIVRYSDNKDADTIDLANHIACSNINELTADGENSALHFASLGESSVTLEFLVKMSPKYLINSRNKEGETPLHWACHSGYLDNIRTLLNAGADPKAIDDNGNTILHCAVEAGKISASHFILSNNLCDKNTSNNEYMTPLATACEEEEPKLVKLLKVHGASSTNLLREYIQANKPKYVKQLIKGCPNIYMDKEKRQNPLHYAVEHNQYEMAKVLMKINSYWMHETDSNGNTPKNLLSSLPKSSRARLVNLLQ